MSDPRQLLETAKTILLVDWPNPGVPRALVGAGFKVFGFCPSRYSRAEVVADRPRDVGDNDVFPPKSEGERGYLVFRRLEGLPDAVDVVNVYRPVKELPGIVANQVLPLGAKVLWLQSPVAPADAEVARGIARDQGLVLVEGVDIAEKARTIDGEGSP